MKAVYIRRFGFPFRSPRPGYFTGTDVNAAFSGTILGHVPAPMELLGERNWWLPRWLGRLLPRIDVEGRSSQEAGLASGISKVTDSPSP